MRENIEPPDVEPTCPIRGLRLNWDSECPACKEEADYEYREQVGLDNWKGYENE